MNALARLGAAIDGAFADLPIVRVGGVIREVAPTHYRVSGLSSLVRLGDRVSFAAGHGDAIGEVVRVDRDGATIKPFDGNIAVGIGTVAYRMGPVGPQPGAFVEGPRDQPARRADRRPRPACLRRTCHAARRRGAAGDDAAAASVPLKTGVRVIDLFTPLCKGQRIGIFAGSGVGKSTLLSMLARSEGFDTVVVALVGERGREVREFLEVALAANRSRAVTVVSTGDESPMMRRLAPLAAVTIAEYFRDLGEFGPAHRRFGHPLCPCGA